MSKRPASSRNKRINSKSNVNLPFKNRCILCNELVNTTNKKGPEANRKLFRIPDNLTAGNLKEKISKAATMRGDKWGVDVLGRLHANKWGDCKKDCNNRRCSCKKNGVKCISACGTCHGRSCSNTVEETVAHDNESVGDDFDH